MLNDLAARRSFDDLDGTVTASVMEFIAATFESRTAQA
jgi:hypothetical protein